MAKDVIGLINKSSNEVDIVLNEVIENIDNAVATLNTTMAGVVSSVPVGSTVEANMIALNEGLRTSGFLTIVGANLNSGYKDVINVAGQLNEQINERVFAFTENESKKLKSLKQSTFINVQDSSNVYLGKINNALNSVRFGTGNALAIVQNIDENFGKTLANQVTSIVDTGVSAGWRESNIIMAEANGIDRFIFSGTLIPTSRPFCARHLNEIRTIAGWDTLSNGQGLFPVSVFLGGFRCRHVLVGVSAASDKLNKEPFPIPEAPEDDKKVSKLPKIKTSARKGKSTPVVRLTKGTTPEAKKIVKNRIVAFGDKERIVGVPTNTGIRGIRVNPFTETAELGLIRQLGGNERPSIGTEKSEGLFYPVLNGKIVLTNAVAGNGFRTSQEARTFLRSFLQDFDPTVLPNKLKKEADQLVKDLASGKRKRFSDI